MKYRRELEKKEKYVVLLNKDNLDEEITIIGRIDKVYNSMVSYQRKVEDEERI